MVVDLGDMPLNLCQPNSCFLLSLEAFLPIPIVSLQKFQMANMNAMARSSYGQLQAAFAQGSNLEHAISMLRWDSMVKMPPGAAKFRGETIAELETTLHAGLRDLNIPRLIAAARADVAESQQRRSAILKQHGDDPSSSNVPALPGETLASLREMERASKVALAVDPELTRRKSRASGECELVWRGMRQRGNGAWSTFMPKFSEMLELIVEEGKQLALAFSPNANSTSTVTANVTPSQVYDALLDKYEPGVKAEAVQPIFDDLESWLPGAIKYVAGKHAAARRDELDPFSASNAKKLAPFSIEQQHALEFEIAATFGLDMGRARIDAAPHPFCGGVPRDTRITTRYNVQNPLESLFAVIHESGHGRYEQNLPIRHHGVPVGKARSMGIHESQSLLCEMTVARGDPFLRWLSPKLVKAFPDHDASLFTAEVLARHLRKVKPGFIRVHADELTYPMHVAVRFQIERQLVTGSLPVADVPKVWASRMEELLGVTVKDDDHVAHGCMQDIHWAMGAVGYFPTYTLGAAYAAQIMAAMTKSLGGEAVVAKQIEEGNHVEMVNWLRSRIWSKGSTLPTPALVLAATEERLNPQHYRDHLMKRYVNGT